MSAGNGGAELESSQRPRKKGKAQLLSLPTGSHRCLRRLAALDTMPTVFHQDSPVFYQQQRWADPACQAQPPCPSSLIGRCVLTKQTRQQLHAAKAEASRAGHLRQQAPKGTMQSMEPWAACAQYHGPLPSTCWQKLSWVGKRDQTRRAQCDEACQKAKAWGVCEAGSSPGLVISRLDDSQAG